MANAAAQALTNVKTGLKKVKATVVDATSDVLSAPARAVYGAKGAQAGRDEAILKAGRASKGAPQFEGNGSPSVGFMAQTMADEVRQRRMKK